MEDEVVEIDLSKEEKKDDQVEKVEAKEPEKEPEIEQDDGSAVLQQQLHAAQAAAEAARRAHAEEQKLRVQAQQQAYSNTQGRAQAEYDAILSAIGAARAEGESAEKELTAAVEAQDAAAMAAAQRRIARSEAYLAQLEDGKNAHELRREQYEQQVAAYQAQQAQQQRQPQRQPTVQEAIHQNPNFLDSEKQWLLSHPEVLTNAPKNAKATAAFFEAQEKGIQRGSKEYFAYMDKQLGYAKKPPSFAAPPSREPDSGSQINGSRVTLTGQQREMAKLSGISEVEYARNFAKMVQDKKSGLIQ